MTHKIDEVTLHNAVSGVRNCSEGDAEMIEYLRQVATHDPVAFMELLGHILSDNGTEEAVDVEA